MARKSWDSYFLDITEVVSTRATCPRLSVGAVIVKDKRLLCSGYNGAPAKAEHCADIGCLIVDNHCQRVIHAEVNAILQAARFGIPIEGTTLYCNFVPCKECFKVIISSGIAKVVYRYEYKASSDVLNHPIVHKEET